ncbi:MAG: DUF4124 domain-containing protein [Halomonas sp.]|nr:DUF4124 domain-containing protein [Halomonas sp.]
MKKPTLFALLVLMPLSSHAELFRCVSNGHTTFQDFPCTDGNSETVDTSRLTIIAPPPPRTHPQPSQSVSTPRVHHIYVPYRNHHQTELERRNSRVRDRARFR